MPNPEHLKILKQGIEVWNNWRISNIKIKPDLSGSYLSKSNFSQIYFDDTDLSNAKLSEADLTKANLNKSNLSGANLIRAKLLRANLNGANLRGANFRGAELILTNLSKADITGAILYGTARDEWHIDRIKCDYVYFDMTGKNRIPADRNFNPGEFEELYKQLPTFDYYFEHGFTPIDTFIMDQVVQATNEKHPECDLKLDSFHSRGEPHAVFSVIHRDYADKALKQIRSDYETRIKVLEGNPTKTRSNPNGLRRTF